MHPHRVSFLVVAEHSTAEELVRFLICFELCVCAVQCLDRERQKVKERPDDVVAVAVVEELGYSI